MSYFSEKLYELRKEKGFSQEELADKLNVARQTISKWENGTTTPDTNNLIELSNIFEISIDDFVGKNKIEDNENKDVEKSKINKKIVKRIFIGIVSILLLVFIFIVINRFILITKIRMNLVTSQRRDIDFSYFQNEINIKSGITSKWNFLRAYRKEDKLLISYYTTDIKNTAETAEAEQVRIEYYDKDNYYDIDLKNKTYKKLKNENNTRFFYNLTGLKLDAEFVKNFGELSSASERILFALNFKNKFVVSKQDTGELVITLRNGENLANQTTVTAFDIENNPCISVMKTNGEYGVIDYKAYSYEWEKVEVKDEDVKLPDLTEYVLIEE